MNYIIIVTPLDGNDPWNITTTNNNTSYIVTGLMFGQSYNFTVRSNNSIGLGEESNYTNSWIRYIIKCKNSFYIYFFTII